MSYTEFSTASDNIVVRQLHSNFAKKLASFVDFNTILYITRQRLT